MEALKKIQQELKAPKGNFNKFGNYKYRSCEDILEAVKPLLAKYDAQLTLADEIVNVGERYYVKATATISDGGTQIATQAYARESEVKKGMDDSQITGTASSYARKYALNGLFLIDDTKDADTDEYHEQTNRQPKKTAPKQTADDAASNEEKKAFMDACTAAGLDYMLILKKAGYEQGVTVTGDMLAKAGIIECITFFLSSQEHLRTS